MSPPPVPPSLKTQTQTTPIIIASLTINDDGQGSNTLSLTGADAAKFSLSGTDLYFSDGIPNFNTPTDSNTDNIYEITIEIDDASIGATPDASTAFTLTILDNEIKFTATDGAASDWFGRQCVPLWQHGTNRRA